MITTESISSLDFTTRMNEVNNITNNYIIISMGAALIPVPLLDLIAISSIQLKMLHKISMLYQIKFSKNLTKPLIGALLGGLIPVSVSTRMASMAKGVFGLGTATGMISMSILSGATTYAISRVFIQHFESGGTFLDFEPEKVREYFMNEFKQGQTIAAQLKEKTIVDDAIILPSVVEEPIVAEKLETVDPVVADISLVLLESEQNHIDIVTPDSSPSTPELEENLSLDKKYCPYGQRR